MIPSCANKCLPDAAVSREPFCRAQVRPQRVSRTGSCRVLRHYDILYCTVSTMGQARGRVAAGTLSGKRPEARGQRQENDRWGTGECPSGRLCLILGGVSLRAPTSWGSCKVPIPRNRHAMKCGMSKLASE